MAAGAVVDAILDYDPARLNTPGGLQAFLTNGLVLVDEHGSEFHAKG